MISTNTVCGLEILICDFACFFTEVSANRGDGQRSLKYYDLLFRKISSHFTVLALNN